ncbi:cystatin-F isoform X2 [Rhinopithecus roxellana]|uniref:cystatin-F isoform X2 n=1 Tax=Rhinopithecus roxellana TaxID=61622 RepID=UPI0005332D0F|nr:cystatin-F isoform X2 [Rhinopithecus roxellana]
MLPEKALHGHPRLPRTVPTPTAMRAAGALLAFCCLVVSTTGGPSPDLLSATKPQTEAPEPTFTHTERALSLSPTVREMGRYLHPVSGLGEAEKRWFGEGTGMEAHGAWGALCRPRPPALSSAGPSATVLVTASNTLPRCCGHFWCFQQGPSVFGCTGRVLGGPQSSSKIDGNLGPRHKHASCLHPTTPTAPPLPPLRINYRAFLMTEGAWGWGKQQGPQGWCRLSIWPLSTPRH